MFRKCFILIFIFISFSEINAQTLKLFDDFDSYNDFIIDSIGKWTMIDSDKSVTYNIANHDFMNESYIGSFIIFNQNQTQPPLQDWNAHSGNKFLACFDAVYPPNNDWIISDSFVAGKIDTVSFWVKSASSLFPLERFNVYLMANNLQNTIVKKLNFNSHYEEAPLEWTKVDFIITQYAGDTLKIGIQCVSDDSYCLQIDDFSVRGRKYEPTVLRENDKKISLFPNPTKGIVFIDAKLDEILVFNSLGTFLFSSKKHQIDLMSYVHGIYLLKIISGKNIISKKIILE